MGKKTCYLRNIGVKTRLKHCIDVWMDITALLHGIGSKGPFIYGNPDYIRYSPLVSYLTGIRKSYFRNIGIPLKPSKKCSTGYYN